MNNEPEYSLEDFSSLIQKVKKGGVITLTLREYKALLDNKDRKPIIDTEPCLSMYSP